MTQVKAATTQVKAPATQVKAIAMKFEDYVANEIAASPSDANFGLIWSCYMNTLYSSFLAWFLSTQNQW
jgi:hypothetical protein